jgi:hypothetical protein
VALLKPPCDPSFRSRLLATGSERRALMVFWNGMAFPVVALLMETTSGVACGCKTTDSKPRF